MKSGRHPNSRTPFRIELKFTAEEWERLGDLGTARGRSRYNYLKHIALNPEGDWEHHFKVAAK